MSFFKKLPCCRKNNDKFANHWFSLQSKDPETRKAFQDWNLNRINTFPEIIALQFVPIVLGSIYGIYGNGEETRMLHFIQECWMLFCFLIMSIMKRVWPRFNKIALVIVFLGFQSIEIWASHNPAAVHQELDFVKSIMELQVQVTAFLLFTLFFVYDHRIMIFCLLPMFFVTI